MKKNISKTLAFFFLLLILINCTQNKSKKLNIAVAANMEFAMDSLAKTFTNKTGIDCELIIGSSGKLTAQIIEGAPFDVFVAANMKYPEAVFEAGKTANTPKVYAKGKLVLWSMKEGLSPSIALLSSADIRHIALANPKTAPYGTAATEVLTHFNLLKPLNDKLVYGESISQTNQFIISKTADLGFTAKSVVLSPEMKGRGAWLEISDSLYSDIEQGVVVVKQKDGSKIGAEEFYKFLFSDEAKQILKNFGYSVNE